MKTLIMMVGLPRSGKSTVARGLGHPIVSPDAIRLALYGQTFIREAETMVWAIADLMVKAIFIAGHECVILDATNLTKAGRMKWHIAGDWKIEPIVMDTPAKVCIERAREEGDLELIPIIEQMAKTYEPVGGK